jgi:O-Antigen ligase
MDRVLNPTTPVRKLRVPDAGRLATTQPVRSPSKTVRVPAASPFPALAPTRVSSFQKAGLFFFCGYLFSGAGNDLAGHFGGKAYLSWIFGPAVLIAFFCCGSALRGLQPTIGKCWAGIVFCLLGAGAFSMNRGTSLDLMQGYLTKVLVVYFFCAAFALTVRNVRTLIMGNVFCTSVILLSAGLFGAADTFGRFCIPGSIFFGNSNDLALSLVCSLGFSLFLIWQKSGFARILGSAEFLISLYFILKTGSRGGFLALAVCLTTWLIFSRKRGRLLVLAVPAICLVALLPGSILSRLVEIEAPGAEAKSSGNEAQMSQYERTQLLEKSIRFAVTHPVLGTGPGTFMDALWLDDVAFSTHTAALGTHNTYTQLASECGFPVLYLGVLFGSITMNFRVMKRTREVPGAEKVFTMAVCLFGTLIAYAVGSGFDHVAYSGTLPLYSGISVALYLATQGGDPRWIEAETAAGNA